MMTMMPDPARYEEMVFQEGRRKGREEATKELMEWHNKVCEEMAKRHTADRPKGEWKPKNHHTDYCSNCGFEETQWRTVDYKFCPICGAIMVRI